MSGFIQGEDRTQATLFPERLDDYVADDSPVRVIDVFIDELDLADLGFKTQPNETGRPACHPATMLKLFVYGYLNQVQSSRRLEREAQRNVELMWLTGRLAPDFKTIADFRQDNGEAIRRVCRQFVILCRNLNLFRDAFVAIDGSKFKAVNNRDRSFTRARMKRRLAEVDAAIERYLRSWLKRTDGSRRRIRRSAFRYIGADDEYECPAGNRLARRISRVERGMLLHRYWSDKCGSGYSIIRT